MYQVYVDNNLMHDAYIEDLCIFKPKLSLEQNAIGSFEFEIQKSHPHYENLARMKSIYTVYNDGVILSKGRIIELGDDTYKTRSVYCEDVLGYFMDSIVSPYDFSGDIDEYLGMLIDQHNAQVDDYKKFKLGTVTVTDPNDYITRADSTYPNTWDTIKKKLIELLGGYLRVRYEQDGMYIDYLEDYTTLNSQVIEFGENLLNVETVGSATDIATVIIPLGVQDQETQQRLTIASVNDDVIYVEDTDAIAKYGRITKVVTYDDVTIALNLKNKGIEYLNSVKELPISIEIDAVDMARVGQDINNFDLYSKIKVVSTFHDLDDYFVPLKLDINLFEPEKNKITLNSVRRSLTEGTVNDIGKVDETFENIQNNTQQNIANQIINLTQQLTSLIDQSATQIRFEVSESYYNKEDTDQLIANFETAWIQDKNSFELQFNQFKQDIEDIANGTNADFQDIRKYIRFIDGDINLGQVGNEFQCWIAKDKISFMQGANEVAYFSNSQLYVSAIRALNSLQIGGYQWKPRESGSVSFVWVGGEVWQE